jgi:hypothetical protein
MSSVTQPWMLNDLRQEIADYRWNRQVLGITIGDQVITTERHEMAVWQGMLLDIVLNPGVRTEFDYKPVGGENILLTVPQVQRCYACFAWYTMACYSTERYFNSLIIPGMPESFEAVAAQAFNPANWPQRQYSWIPE